MVALHTERCIKYAVAVQTLTSLLQFVQLIAIAFTVNTLQLCMPQEYHTESYLLSFIYDFPHPYVEGFINDGSSICLDLPGGPFPRPTNVAAAGSGVGVGVGGDSTGVNE